MCTVSVVPTVRGFRLMCNRDELVTRPPALPPVTRRAGVVCTTYPVDPKGGGTWVAVNDAGLAVALLNRLGSPGRLNPTRGDEHALTPGSVAGLHSRGEIVPRLASEISLSEAQRAACNLQPTRYAAFRVVMIQGRDVVVATSDAAAIHVERRSLRRPMMFTSSSRGDVAAERIRRSLFDALVLHAADPLIGQHRFHDHRWPDCPDFSVRMRRDDARTVSRSVVEVEGATARLRYESLEDD